MRKSAFFYSILSCLSIFVVAVCCTVSAYSQVRTHIENGYPIITVNEPLGRSWKKETIAVDLLRVFNEDEQQKIAVLDEQGHPLLHQFISSAASSGESLSPPQLLIQLDLEPHEEKTLRVGVFENIEAVPTPLFTQVKEDVVSIRPLMEKRKGFEMQLRHGKKDFDPPKPLRMVEGPVVHFVGPDRVTRGGSHFGSVEVCSGYEGKLIESGPLRIIYEITYRMAMGTVYRQRWTFTAGSPSAVVDEFCDGESFRGMFYLSFEHLLIPNKLISHNRSRHIFGVTRDIDYVETQVLAELQGYNLNNENPRWVGLYRNTPGYSDVFVISRKDGSTWSGRPMYIMEMVEPTADLVAACPLDFQHRRWIFGSLSLSDKADWRAVYPNIAAWPERHGLDADTAPKELIKLNKANNLELAAQVFATQDAFFTLDEILRETFLWDDGGEQGRTHPLADTQQLESINRKIQTEFGKALWEKILEKNNETESRPGRVDQEQTQRLECRALVAALAKDTTGALNLLDELNVDLQRTVDDTLLYGPEFPTALDIHSQGIKLFRFCRAYSLVAGLIPDSATQAASIRAQLAFSAYWLMDSDIFPHRSEGLQSLQTIPEWANSARCAGLASFAFTFPSHPDAKKMADHAYRQIRLSLDDGVYNDGGFPEAPWAIGEILTNWLSVSMLTDEARWNLFLEPNLRKMLVYLRDIYAPCTPGKLCPGIPGIGYTRWNNDGLQVLGIAAAGYADSDPDFAAELQWIWKQGQTQDFIPGDPVAALLFADPDLKAREPALGSRTFYGNGAIFRHRPGTERETVVYCKAGQDSLGYDHDEGTFSLIWHNEPITLDAGADTNDDQRQNVLGSTVSHNAVRFGNRENGWVLTHMGYEERRGALAAFATQNQNSALLANLSSSTRDSLWSRGLVLIDDEYLVVFDYVYSPKVQPSWLLHAFTENFSTPQAKVMDAPGKEGVNLRTVFAFPEELQIKQEEQPHADFENHRLAAISLKMGINKVLAVLSPVTGDMPPIDVSYNDGVVTIRKTESDGKIRESALQWEGFEAFFKQGAIESSEPLIVRHQSSDGESQESVLLWQNPSGQ